MTTPTRVLFVDDDPLVLQGFRSAFHHTPFEVLTASSAEEALQRLLSEDIEVMVTDERMPGMDGSQLCAVLSARGHEVIRIILTGHASLESALRAMNEGEVFRFLTKPVDLQVLIRTILEGVERKRQRASLAHSKREGPKLSPRADALSAREREVAELLVEGLRTLQIAHRMHISRHTVRNHLKSMFQKMEVHSQGELVEALKG